MLSSLSAEKYNLVPVYTKKMLSLPVSTFYKYNRKYVSFNLTLN